MTELKTGPRIGNTVDRIKEMLFPPGLDSVMTISEVPVYHITENCPYTRVEYYCSIADEFRRKLTVSFVTIHAQYTTKSTPASYISLT